MAELWENGNAAGHLSRRRGLGRGGAWPDDFATNFGYGLWPALGGRDEPEQAGRAAPDRLAENMPMIAADGIAKEAKKEDCMTRTARGILSAGTLAAVAALVWSGPALAAKYDGSWSVVIVTQSGDCDQAYRYALNIKDNKVSYAGTENFTVSGGVSGSGAVNVTISRGEQSASGSGQLSANSGSGKWSGKSSTSACSGRWEAEKR